MDFELGLVRALTTDSEFRAEFEADAEGTLTRRGILVGEETRAALVEAIHAIYPYRKSGGGWWMTYRDLTPSALGSR